MITAQAPTSVRAGRRPKRSHASSRSNSQLPGRVGECNRQRSFRREAVLLGAGFPSSFMPQAAGESCPEGKSNAQTQRIHEREARPLRKIKITVGDVEATATLYDNATADAVWEALPLEARANRWGDEIYFSTQVTLPSQEEREVVDAGDLAYWPPGRAFCIFWGPTPASRGDEIRPASP